MAGWATACSSASGSGGSAGAGNGSGAGGSGGISVGGGGSGGVNLDGGGGTGALTGCAKETFGGELVPVDLFIMLDKSGSMDSGQNNTWVPVTNAISQFVDLPGLSKLGMGLGLFPSPPATPAAKGACASNNDCGFYECTPIFNTCSGALSPNDSCVATDYQKPVVGIADLPGVGSAIKSAMSAANPDGSSTTLTPALEGAIDYATVWAQAHTDHVAVVVLATDGEPNNCSNNSVSAAAAIAKEGFTQSPSIRTFVIGMGSLSTLDTIAKEGGTDKAILVSTGNAGKEFLDALNKIRGAVGCQYQIPVNGKADPKKVNVLFTPDDGTPATLIKQVKSAADCLGQLGWYYDADPPTQILLCPGACDLVSNQKGKVEVVLGCQTQVN
ncbi:MAG: vWA domain-containing protein [Polyangiaceae bacterium]